MKTEKPDFSAHSGILPYFSGRVLSFLLAISLHLEEDHMNHREHAICENEERAVAKLRLLIKQPGRANACIPVTVDDTTLIGNSIASLVDHLGFPKRDGLGRVLTYSLRPLSGGHPLPNTLRFVDVQLLPETRLVLEVDEQINSFNSQCDYQYRDASFFSSKRAASDAWKPPRNAQRALQP